MLEVFAASGFTVQRALDTGVFHVSCYVNLQEKKKTLPLSGTLHRSMYF